MPYFMGGPRIAAPDLYSIVEVPGLPGVNNISGRSRVDVTAGNGIAVIVTIGQSDFANYVGTGPYTPTHSTVCNFNVYDERSYQCVDDVLGASTFGGRGSINGRIGDDLITNGKCSTPVIAPISIAGTAAADWAAGGNCNNRIVVLCRRLFNAKLWPVTAIAWMVGETDKTIGTSQSAFAASQASVISTFRNNGCNAPFLVALYSGPGQTSNGIRSAQAAAVDNVTVFGGPDIDAITNRLGDGHLDDTGAAAAATGWATKLGLVF